MKQLDFVSHCQHQKIKQQNVHKTALRTWELFKLPFYFITQTQCACINQLCKQSLSLTCSIWHTREKLCINQVRSLLTMCCLLLRYAFEPGLIAMYLVQWIQVDHQFINRRMLALKKPVPGGKARLNSPEIWASPT